MADERQKKIFLMRVGVIGLTILVLFFWIFNLKNIWRSNTEPIVKSDDLEWLQFKTEWEQATKEMGDRLDELKAAESDQGSSTTANFAATEAAGQELMNDLIKKTEQSTTSLPETAPINNSSNCPTYIDCMPTIGEARPCVIPIGCEGITQIAY